MKKSLLIPVTALILFSCTGDWINHNDIDLLNWNINREMICNFKVINN